MTCRGSPSAEGIGSQTGASQIGPVVLFLFEIDIDYNRVHLIGWWSECYRGLRSRQTRERSKCQRGNRPISLSDCDFMKITNINLERNKDSNQLRCKEVRSLLMQSERGGHTVRFTR